MDRRVAVIQQTGPGFSSGHALDVMMGQLSGARLCGYPDRAFGVILTIAPKQVPYNGPFRTQEFFIQPIEAFNKFVA